MDLEKGKNWVWVSYTHQTQKHETYLLEYTFVYTIKEKKIDRSKIREHISTTTEKQIGASTIGARIAKTGTYNAFPLQKMKKNKIGTFNIL